MRGVTSVVLSKDEPPGGLGLRCLGLLISLIAFSIIIKADPSDLRQVIAGIAAAITAAVLPSGADAQWKRLGPTTYSVTLTSAFGEQTAYRSADERLVRELVEHLNRAIAARDWLAV